ncbi:MAG: hypothetical protein JW882_03625 [Deltaproteobacteria bacterium]|nr:hypothetical protein [Deltaproteobacteria bacterium]
MKKLSGQGQRWLKCFHVFFACLWVGGGFALMLMSIFLVAKDGSELYGLYASMQFLDYAVIATGGVGSLLTGILYSTFTNWGWFKHKWIIIKWCINLYGIILGTFWLGPWLDEMVEIVHADRMAALANTVYLHNRTMSFAFGLFQLLTILFALYLSVHKPWRRKKSEC